MGSLLSTFSCCLWWFLLGALLGWLLNKFLCSCCKGNTNQQVTDTYTPPPAAPKAAEPAPVVNKVADIPEPAPAAKPAPAPAPAAKPKPAAAKAVAIDLAAAKAAGFKIKNADDLTVIEGIGPKINELFKNAGLKTFVDVSNAKVAEMRKVLDDGGSRFRIANPETWAQQAKLAADNKWEALKTLQDELSGGLRK